jgi:glutaredoxin-related protein
MRIRFFGSPECEMCLKTFVLLNRSNVDYEYIDVTDKNKNIQNFCDDNDVDELPHLQFINDDDNVFIEHIGPIDEEDLIMYLVNYFPD